MDGDQEVKAGVPPSESPFSLADLERLLIEFRKKFNSIEMKSEGDYAGLHLAEQQVHEDFINDQLENNRDRYDHIFKTEQGSIYFTTKTAECLRVRKDETMGWQLQFPERKIFFVDEEERVRIRALTYDRHFPRSFDNVSLRKTNYRVGAVPIEFGIVETGIRQVPLTPFSETADFLTIGKQNPDNNLAWNGFHRGHPITQIIK